MDTVVVTLLFTTCVKSPMSVSMYVVSGLYNSVMLTAWPAHQLLNKSITLPLCEQSYQSSIMIGYRLGS